MENIIKGFVTVILILLLVFVGTGLVTSSIATRNARASLDKYVTEIENSNFADEVISAQKDEADKNGYKLTVNKMSRTNDGDHMYGSATLEYKYQIKLLSINETHEITTSIR